MPEGCLPTATVSMRVGGLVVRSITYSLLSGDAFQPGPSATQSIEFATSASWPFGVMARLVGGPKTEFISGRLATTLGFAGSVPMSTIVTVSLPGARFCTLPSSPQMTLVSMPTSMYSALPGPPGPVVAHPATASKVAAIRPEAVMRLPMVFPAIEI